MKVAVAILNWNGLNLLKKFLPKVIKYSPENISIYIIDNNSSDKSIEFVKENYPKIGIIINKDNKGYAGGYNEGLKKVDSEIFILLNSDVEVSPNWLDEIIREFKNNPNTGVVQPKILDYQNRDHFEYAGAAGGMIDKFGYTYCRGRSFWHIEKDEGQYDEEEKIFWASGCCFCIRANVFYEHLGFDESFESYQEEVDLCWRIQNEGKYDIKYLDKSKVYHIGRSSYKNYYKTYYLNFRNNLYMLIKNLPKKNLYVIFIRLFIDLCLALSLVFRKKGLKKSICIIRAYGVFIRNIPKFYKKRNKDNSKFNPKYYSTTSIALKYFFKKN